MTNFNKIYTKNRRTDGKLIKYTIYNASKNNKVLFRGESHILNRENIIACKREEITAGLSEDYPQIKATRWMQEIAIAKAHNEVIKVRFEEEELF